MHLISFTLVESTWTRDSKLAAISCVIALIACGIAFLAWRYPAIWQPKSTTPDTVTPAKREGYNLNGNSAPTPEEIRDAIEQVPIFMQEATSQTYAGVQFDWRVKIKGMTSLSKMMPNTIKEADLVIVHAHYSCEKSHGWIQLNFKLNMDGWPLIRTVKIAQFVRIQGRIVNVKTVGIELNVDDITLSGETIV